MFTPTSTSSIQQAQIPLSPTRHAQIIQTIQTYISNWSLSLESGGSPQQTTDFLSSYSPSIEWYDHAFRIRRVGHEAVLGLHKAFNHCNQPFQADIKVSLLIFSLTHPSPFPRRAPVLSRGPLGSHSCNRACLGWPGMTNPVSDNIQCLPASLPKSRL